MVSFRLLLETDNMALSLRDCVTQSLQSLGIDSDGVEDLMEYCNGKILVFIDDAEAWTERFAHELARDRFFSRAQVLVTARSSSAYFCVDYYCPKITVELQGFTADDIRLFLYKDKFVGHPRNTGASLPESVVSKLTLESSMTMTHAPGWLGLIQHQASKKPITNEEDVEGLTKFHQLLALSVTSPADSDLRSEDDFLEFAIKMGEAFFLLYVHQREKVSSDWRSFKTIMRDSPVTFRIMIDYCMALYMVDEIMQEGFLSGICTMEMLYLVQMSLTVASGRSTKAAEYIQRLINRLADDDPNVKWAREHALDDHDSHSAHVLKRLHDLQVACLRESDVLPTEGPGRRNISCYSSEHALLISENQRKGLKSQWTDQNQIERN